MVAGGCAKKHGESALAGGSLLLTTSQSRTAVSKRAHFFYADLLLSLMSGFFYKSNVTSAAAVEWPLFLLDCRRSWWHSQHAGTLKPRSS